MKVKVTLDNKWYHLAKIVTCIDGNELLGSIKKQSNKRCITFSGRAKKVNDEWVFEPNPKGKNFHRFESAFTPVVKPSRLKLLTDDQVDSVFSRAKLSRKKVPLPVGLINNRIVNVWVTRFINDNTLRAQIRFYVDGYTRHFIITGLVIRNDSGEVSFIPYKGKHFKRFEKYLGVKTATVVIDTLPFMKGSKVGVELKPGVIGYVKLVHNFENRITCSLSFRYNSRKIIIDGFVYKGTNTFNPSNWDKNIYNLYKQYLESR